MTLGELSEKEVINLYNGRAMGQVTDLEADFLCREIRALIITVCDGSLFSFGKRQKLIVPMECVQKIGDDTILVHLHPGECGYRPEPCKKKKHGDDHDTCC